MDTLQPPQPPAQSALEVLNANLLDFQAKQISILNQIVELMDAGPDGKSSEGNDMGYLKHNL